MSTTPVLCELRLLVTASRAPCQAKFENAITVDRALWDCVDVLQQAQGGAFTTEPDRETKVLSPLLTPTEVAALLRVPVATLHQWRWQNRGPSARKIGKKLRDREKERGAFIQRCRDGKPTPIRERKHAR